MRCVCGVEKTVRAADVLAGHTKQCRSCSSREKMENTLPELRRAQALRASAVARANAPDRMSPYRVRYGEEYKRLQRIASSASARCTNPENSSYKNYGARGVQFRFGSPSAMAQWVLDNLGPRTRSGHSIDRIDNNGHYEAGNLRWATWAEQSRNRRRRYVLTEYGERLRRLAEARPDLTYETVRLWVLAGCTDQEILERRKYARD